jgi:galactoside O-acetyltransferase
MSSMKDKMHTGELYLPGDEEIMRHQLKRLDRLYDFNMTRPTELKKREEMLREMFAEIGDDCYIELRRRACTLRQSYLCQFRLDAC